MSDLKTAKLNKEILHKLELPLVERIAAPLFSVIIAILLYWGWLKREEFLVTPEWGAGYWLGLVGGVIFLLIFIYPLRKKARFLRNAGSVKTWFNMHMVMGIVAPVMILFHCNFSLGATNSNIALYSMLLVVASGIGGRYIYAQIHYGLFGTQARHKELVEITLEAKKMLGRTFGLAPAIEQRIKHFEDYVSQPSKNLFSFIPRKIFIGISTWATYFTLRRRLKTIIATQARIKNWDKTKEQQFYDDSCHLISVLLSSIRRMAVLTFYQKLFHNWHRFHVVFFSMLVITGSIHVLVVHMY